MGAVYRREMQSYFYTPAAYVFMGVFVLLASIFFWIGNLSSRSGNLTFFINSLSYLWMLLSPVLTMHLIAGERSEKTDQLIYASPCSLSGMMIGKYAAACTIVLLTVVTTLVYPLIVAVYGKLYLGEMLVGYLGLFLQGCAFVALDLFISCFAKTQMTAVIFGVCGNLVVWLSDELAKVVMSEYLANALNFISLYQRFSPFAQGQLRFSNVLFDLLFSGLMVFFAIRVLDARRWSEA